MLIGDDNLRKKETRKCQKNPSRCQRAECLSFLLTLACDSTRAAGELR